MIFESLWPLAFLSAIPVVIILYLLRPKGKDYRISSTLLWEKWCRNQQSRTFLEKFIHNILMYLQILILLLLVLALMSPYLRREGDSREHVVLVFDTSASMQHDAGSGRTRLEEAVREAKELIASSEDTAFSIVTCDIHKTGLLAVGVKDRAGLYTALEQIECSDAAGDLQAAESMLEALRHTGGEADEETPDAQVIVYTDGEGAGEAMNASGYRNAGIRVMGDAVSNVANGFLSYADVETGEDGQDQTAAQSGRMIRCACSLTNYSDTAASLEVSLYDGEQLLQIRQVALEAGETALCFFDPFVWQGEPLRSEVGAVRFAGTQEKDSLAEDNVAYAIPEQASRTEAVLIGGGNLYIEKAYQAATGKSLPRLGDDGGQEDPGTIRIFDAEAEGGSDDAARSMVFLDETNLSGTEKNVLLTVTDCDLTAGLSAFSIGVNETNLYEVPDWGTGFLWAGERCAGYYGEHDGVKTVVVGFDIRESDFPLKAEFPVFLSNALHFLGDTSLLAGNVYTAGDTVLFHPQAGLDVNRLEAPARKAGLYEVDPGDSGWEGEAEAYVVRFAADESDGRITAQGVSSAAPGSRPVKKQLRNLFLVLALLALAAEWYLYVRQSRHRGWFYPGVRLIGAAMILLALLGVTVSRRDAVTTTVFLVDLSNSNEQNIPAMEEYLAGVLDEMPGKNQYGIITFGKDSMVDQFLTREDSFTGLLSLPDKTATDFETAMSRALAMLPADGGGRVVILTDGRETRGELAGMAPALSAGQVELLALVYDTQKGQDAYVENVELPGYLYQGDAYTMTVTVESSYETAAELQVWMGTAQTQAYAVHLNRGVNQFRFRQTVTGENIESFEVRVAAEGDTCRENDGYHVYSVVDSAPRVLLVTGMGEDSAQYENLLRSAGCRYERVSARNAPDTLSEMLEFKSIVLENVYMADLPSGFLENIGTYVKDYGCGLVCCGGEDSYALGGYRDSVLETVLPVDMELRGTDEIPVTAMIMAIDHSGSMSSDVGGGATSLDLAVAAAKAAVDQVRDTDYVGVITFDDTCQWVVEPTVVSDREAIKAQIDTIASGGGTTIQPALREALKGAAGCEAGIRHVILLTDGQGESRNYQEIISSYQDAGVTLSTVAVGEGSDAGLLERLADQCSGRYYYSDMAEDIPKIFAQEVFLSGDTYLQNGEFDLSVRGNSELLKGLFEDGWPVLYGYVSATPKAASQVLIASQKDDPVLTVMQYGLGHTVAWNTDVTNRWTAAFAGEEDYAQLWKRILDYSVGNAAIGEDTVDVTTAGGITSLVYHAVDYTEGTKVEAVYTDPEGNTRTEPLPATAPGRYEARLETDMTGIYNLSVRRIEDGAMANAVTTAAAIQYADEYKFGISTAGFISFVDRYGRQIDPEENFWSQRENRSRERYELAGWLITAAILWFVMDVAMRRFRFRPQDTRLYRTVCEYREKKRDMGAGRTVPEPVEVQENGREGQEEDRAASDKANKEERQKGHKKRRDGGVNGKEGKSEKEQTLDTSALLKKKDRRDHGG
ncbi:MAG: VWA domain-containing protein [Lachnospiraceae bacterium]|jgi:uncharacterized membrane protein|nr:VWA domain-containing protein [Lachnospiraceae bacterium]